MPLRTASCCCGRPRGCGYRALTVLFLAGVLVCFLAEEAADSDDVGGRYLRALANYSAVSAGGDVSLATTGNIVKVSGSEGVGDVGGAAGGANFAVPGWPPGVSLNVSDYVDLDSDDSLLKPAAVSAATAVADPSKSVLVVVQSAPGNPGRREEIRRSWGRRCGERDDCSLVFSLGLSRDPELNLRVSREHRDRGDLLVDRLADSYNNLTLKTVLGFRHLVLARREGFLFKTDDDSFVNIDAMMRVVEERAVGLNQSLIGFLQLGGSSEKKISSSVARSRPIAHKLYPGLSARLRKWAMPRYMYRGSHYPPFLSGSGYLVSRAAAGCLLRAARTVPLVHLEDVYATGLCAAACRAERFHHPGFDPRRKPRSFQIQPWHVLVHYMTGRMEAAQKRLDGIH